MVEKTKEEVLIENLFSVRAEDIENLKKAKFFIGIARKTGAFDELLNRKPGKEMYYIQIGDVYFQISEESADMIFNKMQEMRAMKEQEDGGTKEEDIEKMIRNLEIRQGVLKEILELYTGRKIGADAELWKGL